MKNTLILLLVFALSLCEAQMVIIYDFERSIEVGDSAFDLYNFKLAIENYSEILDNTNDSSQNAYAYHQRAKSYFKISLYDKSYSDINNSFLLNENNSEAFDLRGRLKLIFEDRISACEDFHKSIELSPNYYKGNVKTYCDEDWDYKKVFKVHCLDTIYAYSSTTSYFKGDLEIIDTVFVLNDLELDLKRNDLELYFDTEFNNIQSEWYTKRDTTYNVQYYRNGQRKSEDRSVFYSWVYNAEWCENGQLKNLFHPNYTRKNYTSDSTFYCNGQKSWQGNTCSGKYWGTELRWYENGQLMSKRLYTKFNKELHSSGELENILIDESYWDEIGNRLDSIDVFAVPLKLE
jgi:tetratricopeptide (TPR) repeat protein